MSSARSYATVKAELEKIIDAYDEKINPAPSSATSKLTRVWSHIGSYGSMWKGHKGRDFSASIRQTLNEDHVEPSIVFLKRIFDLAYKHNKTCWNNSELATSVMGFIAKEMNIERKFYPAVTRAGGMGVPMGAYHADMTELDDEFYGRVACHLEKASSAIPLQLRVDHPRATP